MKKRDDVNTRRDNLFASCDPYVFGQSREGNRELLTTLELEAVWEDGTLRYVSTRSDGT